MNHGMKTGVPTVAIRADAPCTVLHVVHVHLHCLSCRTRNLSVRITPHRRTGLFDGGPAFSTFTTNPGDAPAIPGGVNLCCMISRRTTSPALTPIGSVALKILLPLKEFAGERGGTGTAMLSPPFAPTGTLMYALCIVSSGVSLTTLLLLV